jgi:hypothetical protein
MKTKIALLAIVAVLFAGVFNIWVRPPIKDIVLENSCIGERIVCELIVLLIPLGLIIGGGMIIWRMRALPMMLNRKTILTYLIGTAAMATGAIWFFGGLMDLIIIGHII